MSRSYNNEIHIRVISQYVLFIIKKNIKINWKLGGISRIKRIKTIEIKSLKPFKVGKNFYLIIVRHVCKN